MSAYGPERYPRMGWGMVLACGLRGANVVNLAASGRSTKSFIAEGRWPNALDALDSGDVVLIQFGHNDQKVEDPTRFTQPDGAFSENLGAMIEAARAKGAIPVLLTPVARRRFVNGRAQDTHGAYADAVRRVARERRVVLVDLSADSLALLMREGEARSRSLYLHFTPDDKSPAYPDGVADDTHFSEAGARAIARLVIQRLAQSDAPLSRLADPHAVALAPGFNAGGPACTKDLP
jgi:lysophospholipase L1-like esterase